MFLTLFFAHKKLGDYFNPLKFFKCSVFVVRFGYTRSYNFLMLSLRAIIDDMVRSIYS